MKNIGPLWYRCRSEREISIIGLTHRVESIGGVGWKRIGHIGNDDTDFLISLVSNLGQEDVSYSMSRIDLASVGDIG